MEALLMAADTTSNQANSSMEAPRRARRRRPLLRPALVSSLVVVAGVTLTLAVAQFVVHELRQAALTRFERRVEQVKTTVRNELRTSALWLATAREVIEISHSAPDQVSREFAAAVDRGAATTPIRTLRFVDAASMQAGTGDADPAVRAALRDAAQSGRVLLVAPAAPYSGAGRERDGTLLLALPVRPQGAQPGAGDQPLGFLLASIDPGRLFEPAGISERGLDMRLFIGSPAQAVYAAGRGDDDAPNPHDMFDATETLSFGGSVLTLAFTANRHALDAGASGSAAIILVAGLAGTVLAALACHWMLLRGSGAARTGDAALNEARMMSIVHASSDAIITIDEAQRIIIFNPMAERVFGVSAMEAIGTTLDRFIPARYRAAHAGHVERFGVTGVSTRQMGRQRVLSGIRANGEEFPLEASISQIRDPMGKLYTVVLRDVTERVRAENALRQSREELRDLSANLQRAREEEKMRIARELHDDLGQQLTALKMDLSSVEQTLQPAALDGPASSQAAAETLRLLAGMRRLVDSTVASLRRIAADLRPVMLDDLGLLPAIDWLTRDFRQRYGIPVDQYIDAEQINFKREAATAIFRIVQEALNNVARHADAASVRLRLTAGDGRCTLEIADDGRGSDQRAGENGSLQAQAEERRAFGLIGVRERAHMLGGTVTIETTKDRGFALTVSFPLGAVQQEETLL
jgi:two-component system, NarL family, sensor histidine kinase UhpB